MAKRNEYTRKIDKIIGNKIRYLRLAKGVRIEELAKSIDVTRQQIEKYESGTNRISAGRMLMIAQALNENISYFYTDLDSKTSENAMTRPISKRQERVCMTLTSNFMKIRDTERQNVVSTLVQFFLKESA